MKKPVSLSVIITTYNWPEALGAVLRSLANQDYAKVELLIADDGSDDRTKTLIESWQKKSRHPIVHIWQEDKGFRAAKARNRAIAQAQNDFILFLDGDCMVPVDFLKRYAALAEKGYFVSGNRVLLQQSFTQWVLKEKVPAERWAISRWIATWFRGGCNRWSPLLHLPLGPLRYQHPQKWEGVKTCNLGVWREDLWRVNGLDEDYTGWGYEDSDLVIRLLRAGIQRKEGRFSVPVFHLWHPVQSRDLAKENYARLAAIQNDTRIKAVLGLDQYRSSSSNA